MIKNSSNFKLFPLIVFFSISLIQNVYSSENYIVTIVNKIPITKVDIVNRAKLISLSVDKNINLNNLENYYNQSLKALINERIIFSAGNKINKDLDTLISKKATELLLTEFENSRAKLNDFIKNYSIPETSLLEKYKAQLIWGIVLKNKYKLQFSKIENNIERNFEINKKKVNEDLYDLAEIVIHKKNNSKLLEDIKSALKDGISFLDIAKQVSISSSSKFHGKIGWRNFQDLPDFVKRKETVINEGDIFTFFEKDKIKLVKILVKRLNGKLSENEHNILLAQVKFPINFQKPKMVYEKIKDNLDNLLLNKKDCKILNVLKEENSKSLNLKIIKSRIADLNPKIQNIIKSINFFEISEPIFYGNNGYAYIKCDNKKAKLGKIDYEKIKKTRMNKYFLIYSEKLLKRLNNEANIIEIKKMK